MSGPNAADFPEKWELEEFEGPGVIREPSAAERAKDAAERSFMASRPADLDPEVISFLLAAAVEKLGGMVVFTHEDRMHEYALGFDFREVGPNGAGPIRLYTISKEDS